MAEVILNDRAGGRFLAYSAGSHPTGVVNPAAIARLRESSHDVSGLRSKSWQEFEGPDASAFDTVVTVCDNAANETCPGWIGEPTRLHWGIPDPAAVVGSDDEVRKAFDDAYERLAHNIEGLLSSYE
jgi:protein-tyrosine-phosphatase